MNTNKQIALVLVSYFCFSSVLYGQSSWSDAFIAPERIEAIKKGAGELLNKFSLPQQKPESIQEGADWFVELVRENPVQSLAIAGGLLGLAYLTYRKIAPKPEMLNDRGAVATISGVITSQATLGIIHIDGHPVTIRKEHGKVIVEIYRQGTNERDILASFEKKNLTREEIQEKKLIPVRSEVFEDDNSAKLKEQILKYIPNMINNLKRLGVSE